VEFLNELRLNVYQQAGKLQYLIHIHPFVNSKKIDIRFENTPFAYRVKEKDQINAPAP